MSSNAKPESGGKVDGVTLALLTKRLEGVARKMANTLLRTGRSGVLKPSSTVPAGWRSLAGCRASVTGPVSNSLQNGVEKRSVRPKVSR